MSFHFAHLTRNRFLASVKRTALVAGAALLSIAAQAHAAPTVVQPGSMGNWAFNTADATGTPPATGGTSGTGFVTGPPAPPLGVGSAHLFTGNATVGGDESAQLRNTNYDGTPLTDLSSLGYCTFATQWNGQQVPYLSLQIDTTGVGGSPDDQIFFEPAFQTPGTGNPSLPDQGAVALNIWQCWDAFGGGWWANSGGGTTTGCTPGTGVCSLADYIAQYPFAVIRNSTPSGRGGVRLNVGFASPSDPFDGNVDNVTIGLAGTDTTFDFEPCGSRYVDTAGSDVGNDCGNSAAPCATIQHAIDESCDGDTINVGPGGYTETVSAGHGGVVPGAPGVDINRSVILKGAGLPGLYAIGGHCLPTSCPGGPLQGVTLSAAGITIDGFSIEEFDPFVNVITADGPLVSKNHTIKNNHINNAMFDDSNMGGGWAILLGYSDADNNTITDNDISLNPDLTKNQFTFGVWFQGGGSDNNVVTGNRIHNLGSGVINDAGDTGLVVSNNTFLDNARAGVVDSGVGTIVEKNLFKNNGRSGYEARGDGVGGGATGALVKDNCFDGNGVNPPTFAPCTFPPCSVTPFGAIRIDDDGTPGVTTGTQIHNNNFFGNNAPHGVTDLSSTSTNTDDAAKDNWWGCPTGANTGTCDTTTANVDATPFLANAATGTACTGCTADPQCDDGLACNGGETCNTGSGQCVNGTAIVCPAPTQCQISNSCQEPGTCVPTNKADGQACNDGNICTQADQCLSGVCVGGTGGADTDADGYCDIFENQAGCDPNDPTEIPPQAETYAGSPSGIGEGLVTYTGPHGSRITVATDPTCATAGVCGPPPFGYPTGFCSTGKIGDPCTTNAQCNEPAKTCRLVANYANIVDIGFDFTYLNKKIFPIAGFSPLHKGCSKKVDVTLNPTKRQNNVRIWTHGTVQGRTRRDRDYFIYR
jgi:hypothetical protein